MGKGKYISAADTSVTALKTIKVTKVEEMGYYELHTQIHVSSYSRRHTYSKASTSQ
jgi:hypothetical protein